MRDLPIAHRDLRDTSQPGQQELPPPGGAVDAPLDAELSAVAADLRRWAATYIWWKSPDEALAYPERIIAQVMNIGDYRDVQRLVELLGLQRLRDLLQRVEAGWFNERSWHYWHYRLGLAQEPSEIPPLPARRVE
ncbi:MAG TPA: hypothetical protein VFY89_10205 [Ktedonobacterales bacterium]